MTILKALKITSVLFNLYLIFAWDDLFLDIVGISCLCFIVYIQGREREQSNTLELAEEYEALYESAKEIIEYLDKDDLYKNARIELQMKSDIKRILND
jgi:hypothetical protein